MWLVLLALSSAALPTWASSYTFGTDSQYLARADRYPRWANLLRRQARQSEQIDACVADVDRCPRYLRGLREVVRRSQSLSPYQRIVLANRFINSRHWRFEPGRADDWRTLTDFLHYGGDCEDYAIAKYFVLRYLGFKVAQLRVGIGKELATHDYHAVTMVKVNDHLYMLDVDGEPTRHLHGYRLLFSINEEAIWDHVRPRTMGAIDKQEGKPL